MRLGAPDNSSATIYGPSTVCPGNTASFNVNTIPGATNYTWGWPSGWTYIGGQGTRYLNVAAPYGNFGSGGILLWASNDCGENSTPKVKYINQDYNCGYTYSIFPNPSIDYFEVNVEAPDASLIGSTAMQEAYELILFNDKQQKVKELKTNRKKILIATNDLRKGTYFLHIIDGNGITKKQIIIYK